MEMHMKIDPSSDAGRCLLRAMMALDEAEAILDNPVFPRWFRWWKSLPLRKKRGQLNFKLGMVLHPGDAEKLLRRMKPKVTITKTISGIYEVVVEGEKPIIVTIPWAVGFIVKLAHDAGMEIEQKFAPPLDKTTEDTGGWGIKNDRGRWLDTAKMRWVDSAEYATVFPQAHKCQAFKTANYDRIKSLGFADAWISTPIPDEVMAKHRRNQGDAA